MGKDNLLHERGDKGGKSMEEALEEYAESLPAGRLGTADEIGYLAAFLSSENADT